MPKLKRAFPIAVTCAILVFLSAAARLTPVQAHSWYPQSCCNDKDCRVVDKVDPLPDGAELFHAGSITVIVPRQFKRLPSQDSQVHLCFYRVFTGEYRPRCVFVPGQS